MAGLSNRYLWGEVIIAVVLGSTSSWVWRDSEALLDWALKDV